MLNKIKKIAEKIGNTKTVRLYNIEKKYNLNIHLYAKIESTNLTGSIKDRPVFEIVKNMIENNLINDQSILILFYLGILRIRNFVSYTRFRYYYDYFN